MGLNGRFIVAATGAAAVLLGLFASIAAADEIRIGNIPYAGIRIIDITADSVEYFFQGQRRTAELDRVTVVDIAKYPAFGEAIKQMDSDPATAADQLRGVLADVKEDFLRPLVQSRFVMALDAAGQFDQAVAEYVKLVTNHSDSYFAQTVPSKLTNDPAQLQAAEKTLSGALAGIRGDAQKQAAEKLLAQIQKALKAPPGSGAPGGPPASAGGESAPGRAAAPEAPADQAAAAPEASFISMSVIESLMRSKQYQQAVDQANMMMGRPNAPLPDLFYQRAIAEDAMGEHTRAAMSYLRVAIHFPDHNLAIPALFQAGQQLSKTGDNADAAKVYQQALKRAKDDATKQQIQRALDALPAPGSDSQK
ncbi:MAG: tetratricopeptide repeat protein [Phycisphaeraceae bacterium]